MSIEIIRKKTPHYSSRGSWKPDMICCHQTSGSISSCINWFANPESKVSSHFAVGKDGRVYQFVDISKMAWCNGTSSKKSKSNYYGNSPNELIRARKDNANKYTVSIEFENNDTGRLTAPQYTAGLELMKYIIEELKRLYNVDFERDRAHIIGHCDCSPVNKAGCPGADFPFDRFIAELILDSIVEEKRAEQIIEHPHAADDGVPERVYKHRRLYLM